MPPISDEELKALCRDLESDWVERKSSMTDHRDEIRRAICAFANDLPGHNRPGLILVGVRDDGSCAQLDITDELLSTLAQMKGDGSITPFPSLTVEKRRIEDCDIAVVTVEPSRSPPVRCSGRVWVRVGPTVQQAAPEDEQRLSERRIGGTLSFDMRPMQGATLADLDADYIQNQYLPQAVASEVLEENRRPFERQLQSLRLVRHNLPTHGAMLAFGQDPQAWVSGGYIQFLRFDGDSPDAPILTQKTLTGNLGDVLRRLDEILDVNISVRTEIAEAPREIQRPDYPPAALHQLTRNAVMHRNYEGTNAPIRVYWYKDRIEVQNPGGLYGVVNRENFGTGATDYRNPLIAEIMMHLGYAQKFGMGIPIAKAKLSENGNPPPEFDFQPNHVSVTVRSAS